MNFPAEATKANVKRSQSVQNSEGVISESSRLFQQESGLADGLSAGFEGEERGKKTKKNVMGFKQTCEIGPLNMESPG